MNLSGYFPLLVFQLHHLLALDDDAVVDHPVLMIVAQEPVIEPASIYDRLEEIREPVGGVALVQLLHDAGGSAVGQDAVHLLVDTFQIPDRLRVLLIRGQFLRPPGDALYPEHLPCPALEPVFLLKVSGAAGSRMPS